MLDQAQQTSKAIHNILVLYKISMYTRPIRKYGRGQTNYKNVSPNRLISPHVYGPIEGYQAHERAERRWS
jgi:hypothetical protein